MRLDVAVHLGAAVAKSLPTKLRVGLWAGVRLDEGDRFKCCHFLFAGILHEDMSEIKRRKGNVFKPSEDEQKKQVVKSTKSMRMDLQTASSLLSLVASLGLSWFLFQQSVQLADVEKKYHILKEEAVKFQDMENKISTISEKKENRRSAHAQKENCMRGRMRECTSRKFASSSVLQEVASHVSMITDFEQEVSSLHNLIEDIQNSQWACSKKFRTISKTFQRVVDSWKMSTSEMDTNTSNLRLDTKILHGEIISQINTMDMGLKTLSERLKDLEDSTITNLQTLNTQEESELLRIEQQLQLDKNTAELLKEEHNSLLVRSNDLYQKIVFSEHKLQECKTYLPVIENAIYSILRLSSEFVAAEIKKEDMITKIINVENEIMKATTEIMNIQNALENVQSEDS
ncbi:inhibitor of nuclear factor kappa-B kinase-interacting protein isoform X2 [Erythrolamprus reginae]|uniref:inhibitor of nuclear factor kappa-B kinase-interacting protein isoform X2 n=1 Tax=Erythrolamprus reginae TaxID=121349 RepID=UPI00396CF1E7